MFAIRFTAVDVYFIFGVPLLTLLNTKENICREEFRTLLMEALILSLSRINKHTLSMGIYISVRTKERDVTAISEQPGTETND